jgi:large subunit ribosomal protein L23
MTSHQERLFTVIKGPHLSEKAHGASENNQVVLKVRSDATKKEVAQVESVQVVNMKGKTQRFQQTKGRRSNWKKAYVKLSDGAAIEELFGSE